MVAADQTYLRKYLLAHQATVEIVYVGQGIPIIHSGIVEASKVAAGPPAITWFRDNVKW